jgi:hypothetical protein
MNALLTLRFPAAARSDESGPAADYQFLANIASGDLDRARQAAQLAGPAGEFRLVPIICSELGLPLRGAALYGSGHRPAAERFWKLYHELAPRSAA